MTLACKPKIENPLKTGLRQRAGLGLSKEWLKRRDLRVAPAGEGHVFTGEQDHFSRCPVIVDRTFF